MTTQQVKFCPRCKESLPATREFFHKGTNKFGLSSHCKICARQKALAHHYANHADRLQKQAEYREENRAKLRGYKRKDLDKKRQDDRAYYWATVDDRRAKARAYYRRHKAAFVQRARQWAKANPEKVTAHTRAKAYRRRGAPMDTEAKEYVRIISKDVCVYCGKNVNIVIDHIHPLSAGGNSEWHNLAPACRLCNGAKTNKPLLFFMLERFPQ